MRYRASLDRNLDWNGDDLRIILDEHDGRSTVTEMTFESCRKGQILDPCMQGDHTRAFVQAIMDAGYDAGMRATAEQDPTYLKAHLEDMRDISKHLLKMGK